MKTITGNQAVHNQIAWMKEHLRDDQLDMLVVLEEREDCGTVGCIAGWTLVANKVLAPKTQSIGKAAETLQLDLIVAMMLFEPWLEPRRGEGNPFWGKRSAAQCGGIKAPEIYAAMEMAAAMPPFAKLAT